MLLDIKWKKIIKLLRNGIILLYGNFERNKRKKIIWLLYPILDYIYIKKFIYFIGEWLDNNFMRCDFTEHHVYEWSVVIKEI